MKIIYFFLKKLLKLELTNSTMKISTRTGPTNAHPSNAAVIASVCQSLQIPNRVSSHERRFMPNSKHTWISHHHHPQQVLQNSQKTFPFSLSIFPNFPHKTLFSGKKFAVQSIHCTLQLF